MPVERASYAREVVLRAGKPSLTALRATYVREVVFVLRGGTVGLYRRLRLIVWGVVASKALSLGRGL